MQTTKREKAVIISGMGVLGWLLVLQFVVYPALDRISTLRRVVSDRREILVQLRDKSLAYRNLQAEVSQLRSRIGQQQESRKILSTLDRVRQTCGLSENVVSLKPATTTIDNRYQETTVEIRLEGITMAQLVAFLTQVDSLDLAGGVKALEVQHADRSRGLLRAVIQLSVVTEASGRRA